MTKDELLNRVYEYLLVETENNSDLNILNLALEKIGDLICKNDEVIEKRLTYEPKTNATYIYFTGKKTIKVMGSTVIRNKKKNGPVFILDQDKNGELVGLEVLFVKNE